MTHKNWLISTLSVSMILVLIVSGFNFFIDPLWNFKHSHQFNNKQSAFNERQQKTNYVSSDDFDYDSLLLGSSRTTYINQNDFVGLNVYNYSVSSMSIQEYSPFIEYAKKKRGKDFDTIIIGLDFFKTSETIELENPTVYLNTAQEDIYEFKSLFSLDTLKHSISNFSDSFKSLDEVSSHRVYNRFNVADAPKIDEETTVQNVKSTVAEYKKYIYGNTYKYNENYSQILSKLKEENPNTKFIIFTTPVSSPLFNSLISEGRGDDYKRWINETIDVFGEVNHFMYSNSVSEDLSNYYDGHHYYPYVGTLIAHRLIKNKEYNIPSDFGITLNKNNSHEILNDIVSGDGTYKSKDYANR